MGRTWRCGELGGQVNGLEEARVQVRERSACAQKETLRLKRRRAQKGSGATEGGRALDLGGGRCQARRSPWL